MIERLFLVIHLSMMMTYVNFFFILMLHLELVGLGYPVLVLLIYLDLINIELLDVMVVALSYIISEVSEVYFLKQVDPIVVSLHDEPRN